MNCVIALDLDGTLIPVLVDFDKLRSEIRAMLGVDHPLRPLGESLARLGADENLKKRAWELIERAEHESVHRLNPEELAGNTEALRRLLEKGLELFVVTMRSTSTARAVLEKLGLNTRALKLVTRDVSPFRVEQLRFILENYVGGRRLIFIGDTVYDELAARTLGVHFIRVANYREFPNAVEKAVEACLSKLQEL